MKRMKSFFTLAAAALFTALPAAADDAIAVSSTSTPVSEITEGYYVLNTWCKGATGLVHHVSTDTSRPFRQSTSVTTSTGATDATYVWYVTKTDNGLVIQNASTGAYFPAYGGNGGNFAQSTALSNAAVLAADASGIGASLKLDDNAVTLYQPQYSTKYYIHNNNDGTAANLSYWENGSITLSSSSPVQFSFHKVSSDSYTSEAITKAYAVKVTDADNNASYSAMADGTVLTSTTSSVDGASYWYTKTFSYTGDNLTVSRTNATFTATSTINDKAPFTYYDASNPVYYTVKFRNSDSGYLVHTSSTATNISSQQTLSSITDLDAYAGSLWAFVKSGYGVKILNWQTGKYINVGSSNSSKATLVTEENASVFYGATNSNGGFSLALGSITGPFVGDHASANLGTWVSGTTAQNDGGSNWGITQVNMDEFTTKLTNLYNSYFSANENTTITAKLPSGTLNVKSTDISGVNAKDILSAYLSISDAVTPGYYRILSSQGISSDTYCYLCPNSDGSGITKTVNTAASVNNVVKIAKNDNGYTLAINGKYIASEPGSDNTLWKLTDNADNAGTFTFSFVPSTGLVNIKDVNSTNAHNVIHCNGGSGTNVVRWVATTSDSEVGSGWFLVPATEAEIAVSQIEEGNYVGTAYLPFNATIASDGAKAYLGSTASDTDLKLTETTNIPDAAGVILTATSTPVKVSISSDEFDATSTLGGTYFPITLSDDTRANYLVLGRNNGVLGLYTPSSSVATIPANKAYFANSGSTAIALNFAGNVTAIADALNGGAQNNAPVYDLSGRRVVSPVKGGIYIQNGKKFVK